jgi:hypothetical protein
MGMQEIELSSALTPARGCKASSGGRMATNVKTVGAFSMAEEGRIVSRSEQGHELGDWFS